MTGDVYYRVLLMTGPVEVPDRPRSGVVYTDFGVAVTEAVLIAGWAAMDRAEDIDTPWCVYVVTADGEVKFVVGLPDLSVLGGEPDDDSEEG